VEKEKLLQTIESSGYLTNEVKTQYNHYIIGIGDKEFDIRTIGNMAGIKDVHRVTDNYKFVSRKWKVQNTAIDLGDGVEISRGSLAIMAGPCAIENRPQVEKNG